ncbi:MAG TPA: cytochrome c [Vicinamibacterales bacterium]|jgi:S-disulfanyl-L-cysteine oxidoreductase SoxD|nr:cytochrome c [Vicinamibacterales bacterium]
MFPRVVIGLIALIGCGVVLRAQDTPRIWQGVYTTAQADRGKAVFNTTCLRCHGEDLAGNTAPALKGDRFQSSWGGDVIDSLFTKVRDTMPPNFGTILDDQVKLDIVTYILQTNGFPSGTTELVVGSADLATTQILKKGEQATVQNFSLVQTVGCLATGPNNTWLLTRTAEPIATRDDVPSDRGLTTAASKPLGTRTFRLVSVAPFKPESHTGQKVEARGLIYNEPGDERINLTSLRALGGNCSE